MEYCKKCKKVKEEELPDDNFELLSMISEFNSIHEYMEDDELDRCLVNVVKLIMKPDVPAHRAPSLIVELQAMATKFAILSSYYSNQGRGGPKETHKKNMYYTLNAAITKLVDSLKYTAKSGMEY